MPSFLALLKNRVFLLSSTTVFQSELYNLGGLCFSAAGPSSLRPQHLKDALVPGLKDEVLAKLQQLIELMARGGAPASIHKWISGGSLTADRCGGSMEALGG